jgi:amino acid transporter
MMAQSGSNVAAVEIVAERRKLKRELTLLPLFGLIYFTVSGGSFGIEALVGWSGPGLAMLLIIITPLIFSLPNMLMVRELNSMMPAEGGYYHWIKQAFGPFSGFMAGWMNWIMSFVDVAIYPVLAAYYLGYFFPAIRNGITLGSLELSGGFLSFLVAAVIIWTMSALQVRGARLAGLTTSWLGVLVMAPLVVMTILGIIVWIQSGTTASLPFLPEGETLGGALSVGLFVVMWNYMGWELPAAAGDEIVNPRKTYPRAMCWSDRASPPTLPAWPDCTEAGRKGVIRRGIMNGDGEGIGLVPEEYGWRPSSIILGRRSDRAVGWEFPEVGHAIAAKLTGPDSALPRVLGGFLTVAAVLCMIGLFIGNSLGGSRIPFALAEDGMMPKWLVRVHPRHALGDPGLRLRLQLLRRRSPCCRRRLPRHSHPGELAMWKLRLTRPELPRQKVPGGWLGMVLVTLGPTAIILLAIYSQIQEEGLSSLWLALAAMAVGALLYFPIRRMIKPGVPDVDPYHPEGADA